MTAKQDKAKELMDLYSFVHIQNYTSIHEVKQCVLICINQLKDNCFTRLDLKFWESVEEEINKL